MLVLGIESSCDETAAAVLADGTLRSNVVESQDPIHGRYGGVVPELASRRHLEVVLPVVARALDDAGVRLPDLDGIAVTHGPGLVGSLLVGLSVAKAFAYAHRLPLVGVNHLEGHIFAGTPRGPDPRAAVPGPRGVRRPHGPLRLRGPAPLPSDRTDAGRRRGRGLRQGREAPRARLSGRPGGGAHGAGGRSRRPSRSRSPSSRTARRTSRSRGSRRP